MAIDRSEVNRALAKAIAYKQCGKDAEASLWAAHLVLLLECADILNEEQRAFGASRNGGPPTSNMTISEAILFAVAHGGRRVNPRYLAEVAALHCSGKLRMVSADRSIIIVSPSIDSARNLEAR